MEIFIVVNDEHYEGSFGNLEGPHTTLVGVYDNEIDAKANCIPDTEFTAQFSSAINGSRIIKAKMNEPIND